MSLHSPWNHMILILYLFPHKIVSLQLGKMPHTCSPSSSGGRDWEDCSWRPAQAKRLWDAISTNGWMQWYMLIIPAVQGSTIGGSRSRPDCHEARPSLKNKQSKKGLLFANPERTLHFHFTLLVLVLVSLLVKYHPVLQKMLDLWDSPT
jgi:hypothetical protein